MPGRRQPGRLRLHDDHRDVVGDDVVQVPRDAGPLAARDVVGEVRREELPRPAWSARLAPGRSGRAPPTPPRAPPPPAATVRTEAGAARTAVGQRQRRRTAPASDAHQERRAAAAEAVEDVQLAGHARRPSACRTASIDSDGGGRDRDRGRHVRPGTPAAPWCRGPAGRAAGRTARAHAGVRHARAMASAVAAGASTATTTRGRPTTDHADRSCHRPRLAPPGRAAAHAVHCRRRRPRRSSRRRAMPASLA